MAKKEQIQAVTNAVINQEIQTLTSSIAQLGDAVKDGFKGVHERQDMTNGKVLKANDDIKELTAKFQYNRIIWYMLTTAISVIIALASYIILKHQ